MTNAHRPTPVPTRRRIPGASLNSEHARRMTEEIRESIAAVEQSMNLLAEKVRKAHDAKVWISLGYSGWRAYTQAELGITSRRANQLLELAEVNAGIRESLTELEVGNAFPAPEMSHRDVQAVKNRMPELSDYVTERVQEVLADGQELDADTVNGIVNDAVATVRASVKKATAPTPEVDPETRAYLEQLGDHDVIRNTPSTLAGMIASLSEIASALEDPPGDLTPWLLDRIAGQLDQIEQRIVRVRTAAGLRPALKVVS